MKKTKKTKNVQVKSMKQPDLTMFKEAIYPEDEKTEIMNTEFLFEELKKRRPDKPKIKELIAQPEQCRIPPPHTPKYLQSPKSKTTCPNSPAKENLEMTSRTSHDNLHTSTQAISSRSIDSNDSVKMLSVTCFGSPNVVQFQMIPRRIPDLRRVRTPHSARRGIQQNQSQSQTKSRSYSKPMKHKSQPIDQPTYSWKYLGEANQNLGTFTAKIPLGSDTATASRAQSAINGVRKVHIEKRKPVVHPRDLFALSINNEDDYVKKRTYNMDYDTQIDDNVIAGEDVQTFLSIDDKLIPLKASILR